MDIQFCFLNKGEYGYQVVFFLINQKLQMSFFKRLHIQES